MVENGVGKRKLLCIISTLNVLQMDGILGGFVLHRFKEISIDLGEPTQKGIQSQ